MEHTEGKVTNCLILSSPYLNHSVFTQDTHTLVQYSLLNVLLHIDRFFYQLLISFVLRKHSVTTPKES